MFLYKKNIGFCYSLEAPHKCASIEYLQNKFSWRNNKNICEFPSYREQGTMYYIEIVMLYVDLRLKTLSKGYYLNGTFFYNRRTHKDKRQHKRSLFGPSVVQLKDFSSSVCQCPKYLPRSSPKWFNLIYMLLHLFCDVSFLLGTVMLAE